MNRSNVRGVQARRKWTEDPTLSPVLPTFRELDPPLCVHQNTHTGTYISETYIIIIACFEL